MVGNTQAIWMWAPKDDAMASDLAARDEQPGRSFFPFQAADERESVNPATSAVTCIYYIVDPCPQAYLNLTQQQSL